MAEKNLFLQIFLTNLQEKSHNMKIFSSVIGSKGKLQTHKLMLILSLNFSSPLLRLYKGDIRRVFSTKQVIEISSMTKALFLVVP